MIAIARLFRRPVICRTMAVDAYNLFRQKASGNPLAQISIAELRLAQRVIAQNGEIARQLQDIGVPSVLIPNGVDTALFTPGNRAEQRARLNLSASAPIICYAGRLIPSKHIDVVIRALAESRHRNTVFLLLGDGPERPNLEALAGSLNVPVIFTGFVSDPVPYYQAADIFVAATTMEGHSNALVEALACGLPAIVTQIDGNDETIQPGINGLLVPSQNPAALAQALDQLLSDPVRLVTLGQNARQTVVEKYSLDAMAQRYIDLYKQGETGH